MIGNVPVIPSAKSLNPSAEILLAKTFADPVITGATCVLQHLGQGTISKYGAVTSPILLLASLFTNTLGDPVACTGVLQRFKYGLLI
tara:strand:- start:583 stop:843 length:261 start_codon:yes stop_codon:yes gene_type:complete